MVVMVIVRSVCCNLVIMWLVVVHVPRRPHTDLTNTIAAIQEESVACPVLLQVSMRFRTASPIIDQVEFFAIIKLTHCYPNTTNIIISKRSTLSAQWCKQTFARYHMNSIPWC